MSKEITFVLEPDRGKLTTEVSDISTDQLTDLRGDLGTSQNVNCGKPLPRDVVKPSEFAESTSEDNQSLWLYRIYHNSVVDGPGRRSVIQVAGCSIRCPGCYLPETHARENGVLTMVGSIVDEIHSHSGEIDGVTILGGEPFDQPVPIAELVRRLKILSLSVTVYSGFTKDELKQKKIPEIEHILTNIDLLFDGPYVAEMSAGSGEYRGSRNQSVVGVDAREKNICSVKPATIERGRLI